MDFIKQMDEAVGRLCEHDRLIEQQKRDYGCGVEVSVREIHVLEAIVNHPEKRAGELAQMVGLLKGTFSKTTTRLCKLGFIVRKQQESNNKDVYFLPTALGMAAYEGHYAYHEKISAKSYEHFRHYMPEEQRSILDFIGHYTEYLKEYL